MKMLFLNVQNLAEEGGPVDGEGPALGGMNPVEVPEEEFLPVLPQNTFGKKRVIYCWRDACGLDFSLFLCGFFCQKKVSYSGQMKRSSNNFLKEFECEADGPGPSVSEVTTYPYR